MAVSPLLAVFGFLTGRAATVSTGDVLLFLGLGLDLILLRTRSPAPSEGDAILQNLLEIVFFAHSVVIMTSISSMTSSSRFNDGTNVRQ